MNQDAIRRAGGAIRGYSNDVRLVLEIMGHAIGRQRRAMHWQQACDQDDHESKGLRDP